MCVEAEGKWNQNLTEINIRIYLILFLSRLIYRSMSLRFFLSIFGCTVRFLFRVACASRAHIPLKLWSWKIVALSPGMYFISENTYCWMRRTFIWRIYLEISPRRVDKIFFFFFSFVRDAGRVLRASTERQKGVRDRHENDSSPSASASWPLLSYDGIALPSARTGNRRGKYFPF